MNVGEMQRKLSLWAEKDKEFRFFDLYHLLHDMEWLRLAHDYVAQNTGSVTAGCDGIDMKDFDKNLEGNLEELAKDLKVETFEPYPVRRVNIPKSNGKVRPLGIPSMRDRIVQEAVRMILEPIYEADFVQRSFGFRPNRCTMDAIKAMNPYVQNSTKFFWVIEGDISSYFDTINHKKLLQLLRRRIKDEKLLRLIWMFLKAGVMEGKLFKDTKQGTPQGGIISPLLANVYLHELDRYMLRLTDISAYEKTKNRKQGKANFTYIRYADDFIVLSNGTKSDAESMKEVLRKFLCEELNLTLSMEKTKVTHINEGFKFLGFWIQRKLGEKGNRVTKTLIPKESVKEVISKVTRATDKTTHRDSINAKVPAINRIIEGWCRYYQYTSRASTEFKSIEHETFWLLAHWIGRKYRFSMPIVLRRYYNGGLIGTKEYKLARVGRDIRTKRYPKRIIKPNPYTTQEVIQREDIPTGTYWTGYETRPGMRDLVPRVLERDNYTCQKCGISTAPKMAHVDHVRPVRRFKRPIDANTLANLQTLCINCHVIKTKLDQQGESRVQ